MISCSCWVHMHEIVAWNNIDFRIFECFESALNTENWSYDCAYENRMDAWLSSIYVILAAKKTNIRVICDCVCLLIALQNPTKTFIHSHEFLLQSELKLNLPQKQIQINLPWGLVEKKSYQCNYKKPYSKNFNHAGKANIPNQSSMHFWYKS